MSDDIARLHYFGGTTGHWAGWCARLDPIDFEKRPWVPHSGWPIGYADLESYYARAHLYPELGAYEYSAAAFENPAEGHVALPLDEAVVWTKMWHFSPPTRFGKRYRPALVHANNTHVFTHAGVTDLETDADVRTLNTVHIHTKNGRHHQVRARFVVLACGAIQNARVLLAANRQAPNGLGNDHDQVGRYFMEHFEMGGGQLQLKENNTLSLYASRFYGKRQPAGEFAITEQVQWQHGILNGTASTRPGRFPDEIASFFCPIHRT